jgi:hypothetical protein
VNCPDLEQLLLVAPVAFGVVLVALGGGQAAQAELFEDAVDGRGCDVDVVVPLEVHLDLHWDEW